MTCLFNFVVSMNIFLEVSRLDVRLTAHPRSCLFPCNQLKTHIDLLLNTVKKRNSKNLTDFVRGIGFIYRSTYPSEVIMFLARALAASLRPSTAAALSLSRNAAKSFAPRTSSLAAAFHTSPPSQTGKRTAQTGELSLSFIP